MKEVKKKRVAWNKGLKRTEAEKQKQKETVYKKYGVYNVSQIKEVREKIHLSHSTQEWKDKVKKTLLERYGDEHYNNMQQIKNTKLERYGDANYNNTSKNTATKAKNNTFNTSSPEENFYKYLLTRYDKNDIIRQYKDLSRYPYNCDFYIKSKDLFIELNIHPCHGGKPYTESTDKELLEKREEKAKNSQYYKNMIAVWTIKDVNKLKCAKRNNLNYITIYSIKELKNIMNNNLI